MELRRLPLISLYSRGDTIVEDPEGREAAVEWRMSSGSVCNHLLQGSDLKGKKTGIKIQIWSEIKDKNGLFLSFLSSALQD